MGALAFPLGWNQTTATHNTTWARAGTGGMAAGVIYTSRLERTNREQKGEIRDHRELHRTRSNEVLLVMEL